VKALGREVGPAFLLKNQTVEFVIPENLKGLFLSVVIGAGEADSASLSGDFWFDDLIDQPTSRADLHEFTNPGDRGSLPSDRGGGLNIFEEHLVL
jgi:hypothetical protein